jgi:hypothetical protein
MLSFVPQTNFTKLNGMEGHPHKLKSHDLFLAEFDETLSVSRWMTSFDHFTPRRTHMGVSTQRTALKRNRGGRKN